MADLNGVYAVPPLPRRRDERRALDLGAAEAIARHIEAGGITRFLYGGNAFLYHVSLDEFAALIDWLAGFPPTRWPIPSIGPSFGRAIDQARLLRKHSFPAVMMLPCGDPRDARGLETGMREIVHAAGAPLILYLKSEDAFGGDRDEGLDAIGRLLDDGTAMSIKYAVVRDQPGVDPYLDALLTRVDRRRVISGMGERPAIEHLRDYKLGGLTTGSGCIAPRTCQTLFEAAAAGDWNRAAEYRGAFMPLEDLRDRWGPARVLHHATELAGVASTGPIPPYVSALAPDQMEQLAPVARTLLERDTTAANAPAHP
jgi:dihydrodipicolinate synthase/N-acetylneuraminate lyase